MPIYDTQKFTCVMRPEPIGWKKDIFDIPFIEREELPISLMGSDLFLINPANVSKKRYRQRTQNSSFIPF